MDVFGRLAAVSVEGGGPEAMLDLCGEDVVFEFPFAPPGRPERVEGKAALREYLRSVADAVRLEAVPSLEVHESVDPNVAIIEMTTTGTVTATGAPFRQRYVAILTVRDGLISHYRDYWNPLWSAQWSAA
ncbi:nuclear transport factor 2 family protein [Actinocorallia sp. A-T 12471]|uniref:nuclear transport factor 2 family protein n=1 Tax=Actinocorallia sp. A-T 12471 TaxID=3089813 RepID=UPI0029D3043D|nr:nuclear transport factor 2 family protein [Actinocorallia sp. A-T 12471]MDX6741532.1 nuclear transport factor 2 family protein [Actinocorallia sp. A-T 12471]